VVTPGVVPHVQSSHNMRVPDLAVTCSDYETEEAELTDPVLIVEILSPSNQAETWANVVGLRHDPKRAGDPGAQNCCGRGGASAPARRRKLATGA
jgi:hypothetical protein